MPDQKAIDAEVIAARTAPQCRAVSIEHRAAEGEEPERFAASLSSEEPYRRWYGIEILDHAKGAVDLSRAKDGLPLLFGHDAHSPGALVGRAENVRIDGKRLRADLRFFSTDEAQRVATAVREGHREMSIGYNPTEMVLEKSDDTGETYRVTRWMPFEASIVSVPADASVGIGRSHSPAATPAAVSAPQTKEIAMPEATPAPAEPVKPDLRLIETNAADAERERVTQIFALGEHWQQRDMAAAAVKDKQPLEVFRAALLDRLKTSNVIRPAESPDIGMSEKEKRQYSFCRALLAIIEPNNAEAQRAAAFEHECSVASRDKRGDLPKDREAGLSIPSDMLRQPLALSHDQAARVAQGMQQRDLVAGTTTAGGHTVATDLLASSFIELLVNRMVVMGLGTRVLRDLSGNVAIPSQSGGATAYWVAENGAPTESQQVFGQVPLTPKTVGAFTDYSRRLLLQSSIDVEAFVRFDLARTLALALDLAAIAGTGSSNQPTGILSTAGIGSVAGGTNGLAAAWDHFVDLETAVANANAAVGAMHYLTNTKVRGKSRKTQQFSSTSGRDLWDAVSGMYGPPAVSNQVPSNLTKGSSSGVCSAIIFGNFEDLIVGMWGGLDMMLDPYTGATAGTKRVVALQDVDIAVRHAASFAAMLDALTA